MKFHLHEFQSTLEYVAMRDQIMSIDDLTICRNIFDDA